MDELNKAIAFVRTIPQNKWDQGKYMEIYETRYREALKRLEKFVQEGDRTNEHIRLLEEIIDAKKRIEWINRGLNQLIEDKIHLLESML